MGVICCGPMASKASPRAYVDGGLEEASNKNRWEMMGKYDEHMDEHIYIYVYGKIRTNIWNHIYICIYDWECTEIISCVYIYIYIKMYMDEMNNIWNIFDYI
jgi:hypothetical protein